MQVSVEALLEWEVLPTTTPGLPEADDLRFSWLLELTTSLVQVVVVVAVTALLVAQVAELQEFLLAVAAVHKLLVVLVRAAGELLESNTQVVLPQLQPLAKQVAKVVAAAAVGTAAAAAVTTLVVAVALVTLLFSQVVIQMQEAEKLRG
jgi:hypothetical protein